jgi:hypothetical protein
MGCIYISRWKWPRKGSSVFIIYHLETATEEKYISNYIYSSRQQPTHSVNRQNKPKKMSSNETPNNQDSNNTLLGGVSNLVGGTAKTAGGAVSGTLGTVGDTVGAAGKGVGNTLGQTTEGLGSVTKGVGGTVGGVLGAGKKEGEGDGEQK